MVGYLKKILGIWTFVYEDPVKDLQRILKIKKIIVAPEIFMVEGGNDEIIKLFHVLYPNLPLCLRINKQGESSRLCYDNSILNRQLVRRETA